MKKNNIIRMYDQLSETDNMNVLQSYRSYLVLDQLINKTPLTLSDFNGVINNKGVIYNKYILTKLLDRMVKHSILSRNKNKSGIYLYNTTIKGNVLYDNYDYRKGLIESRKGLVESLNHSNRLKGKVDDFIRIPDNKIASCIATMFPAVR